MANLSPSPREWWSSLSKISRFYRSKSVPAGIKLATVALSALYLLMPADLLPDLLPVVGQLDDITVLALVHLAMAGWADRRYRFDGRDLHDARAPR